MNLLQLLYPWVFYIFCAVIVIQIFYYLCFFSRLAFYKPPQKLQSQEYPVSVVVCARDEAGNLVKNLPGILVQEYATTHEIIVVNDNSTDETKYILEEFKKSFRNLNPIELTQEAKMIPGKKFPLSIGIKSARHEIILLTDADCTPASEHWLYKMQEGYGITTDIVLGYGAYTKSKGILNRLIRFETFHTACQYLSFALAGLPYMGVGRNLSYKKDMFLRNKGFSSINHIPGGDDDLFINKIATSKNTAIVIDPQAHTLSDAKKTWGDWIRQKQRHYTTSKYYKPRHKFLLGLYAFSNTLVYPLLVVSAVFYCWWLALAVYGLRLLVQAVIWYKAMRKLNESDLWPYFLFFDIWNFFYYLLFLPSIWKKPRRTWN